MEANAGGDTGVSVYMSNWQIEFFSDLQTLNIKVLESGP